MGTTFVWPRKLKGKCVPEPPGQAYLGPKDFGDLLNLTFKYYDCVL